MELSGAGATGVPARKRQSAQPRRNATRQPDPKSQNDGGTLSIGQGFKFLLPSSVSNPPSYKYALVLLGVHYEH